MLIYALCTKQWECVADTAVGRCGVDARRRYVEWCRFVQVGLLEAVVVGVGRVHPPGVDAEVEEALQVVPVDVACVGHVWLIHTHTAWVVHVWRPGAESALRPCLVVVEQSLWLQLTVSLGMRTKRLPNTDAHVSILTVYVVYHGLRIRELGVEELHGIPQVVGVPVLPVEDDAVERHTELTVFIDHLGQFATALVAFAALPVAIGIERNHRHVACEFTYECHDSIGCLAIDEVVVEQFAHLAGKRHSAIVRTICKLSWRVVVPEHRIAFLAVEYVLEIFEVALHHTAVLATLVHLAILDKAHTIDVFVGIEGKCLSHLEASTVEPAADCLELVIAFGHELLAFCSTEGNVTSVGIDRHGECFGRYLYGTTSLLHAEAFALHSRFGCDYETGTSRSCGLLFRVLHHSHDVCGVEHQLYLVVTAGGLYADTALGCLCGLSLKREAYQSHEHECKSENFHKSMFLGLLNCCYLSYISAGHYHLFAQVGRRGYLYILAIAFHQCHLDAHGLNH